MQNPDYGNMRFPNALSVSELNSYIKDLLDLNPPLCDIYIKGEISNFKAHSSGHFYFSLKDDSSSLKCVMFRSSAYNVGFMPENGMKIIAHGRISAFVRDGAYQLYCDELVPDGIGAMHIAIEQLKRKLDAEGLFDTSRKMPLPKVCLKLGVVTSPTGAAVRDIINVSGRRFPLCEVFVYPALVQGEGAIDSITRGIEYFNENLHCDVLIIGRGGGSAEDLWAFNSEKVARAVSASKIPVISAVGHETDFTICDMVADFRAPTPSAAAELAVPSAKELSAKLENVISKMTDILSLRISNYRETVERCGIDRESAILQSRIEKLRSDVLRLSSSRCLTSAMADIDDKRMAVLSLCDKLDISVTKIIESKKNLLANSCSSLSALNPLAVLSRGYGAVFDGDGNVIKSTKNTSVGQSISIKLSDGKLFAKVTDTKPGND